MQPVDGRYCDAMSASRSALSYSAALNRNELYATPGLHLDIPTVLAPDEEVILALPGVAGEFPFVLIVSETRVLLAKVAGILRSATVKRQAPASTVTGVSYRPGVFTRMHIHVRGKRDIAMLPHRKHDAERFAKEMEELLRTGRRPS